MKKSAGFLALVLSSVVLSASCASSRATSGSKPAAGSGENWASAEFSELPAQSAGARSRSTVSLRRR